MAAVMIGVYPHKGSYAAAAIGVADEPLGELGVRSLVTIRTASLRILG